MARRKGSQAGIVDDSELRQWHDAVLKCYELAIELRTYFADRRPELPDLNDELPHRRVYAQQQHREQLKHASKLIDALHRTSAALQKDLSKNPERFRAFEIQRKTQIRIGKHQFTTAHRAIFHWAVAVLSKFCARTPEVPDRTKLKTSKQTATTISPAPNDSQLVKSWRTLSTAMQKMRAPLLLMEVVREFALVRPRGSASCPKCKQPWSENDLVDGRDHDQICSACELNSVSRVLIPFLRRRRIKLLHNGTVPSPEMTHSAAVMLQMESDERWQLLRRAACARFRELKEAGNTRIAQRIQRFIDDEIKLTDPDRTPVLLISDVVKRWAKNSPEESFHHATLSSGIHSATEHPPQEFSKVVPLIGDLTDLGFALHTKSNLHPGHYRRHLKNRLKRRPDVFWAQDSELGGSYKLFILDEGTRENHARQRLAMRQSQPSTS